MNTIERYYKNSSAIWCPVIFSSLAIISLGLQIWFFADEEEFDAYVAGLVSILTSTLTVAALYYVFFSPYATSIFLNRANDTITVRYHLYCDRKLVQTSLISQISDI